MGGEGVFVCRGCSEARACDERTGQSGRSAERWSERTGKTSQGPENGASGTGTVQVGLLVAALADWG
jgi:hypothetical protein